MLHDRKTSNSWLKRVYSQESYERAGGWGSTGLQTALLRRPFIYFVTMPTFVGSHCAPWLIGAVPAYMDNIFFHDSFLTNKVSTISESQSGTDICTTPTRSAEFYLYHNINAHVFLQDHCFKSSGLKCSDVVVFKSKCKHCNYSHVCVHYMWHTVALYLTAGWKIHLFFY